MGEEVAVFTCEFLLQSGNRAEQAFAKKMLEFKANFAEGGGAENVDMDWCGQEQVQDLIESCGIGENWLKYVRMGKVEASSTCGYLLQSGDEAEKAFAKKMLGFKANVAK